MSHGKIPGECKPLLFKNKSDPVYTHPKLMLPMCEVYIPPKTLKFRVVSTRFSTTVPPGYQASW